MTTATLVPEQEREGVLAVARSCAHCGGEFRPRHQEERFCCSGCRVVYDALHAGGLGSFYELLGGQKLDPAREADSPVEIAEALEAAIGEAEEKSAVTGDAAQLQLHVGNLTCTACIWLVDHLFRKYPGALKLASDVGLSVLTIWWTPGDFAIRDFLGELHRFGYTASPYRKGMEPPPGESGPLLTRLGVTGGLAMNAMAFTLPVYLGLSQDSELAKLFALVTFASASLAIAVGGSYFFQRAYTTLRAGAIHMDVPIALGLIFAYLGSIAGWLFEIEGLHYFDFVAIFTFLMLAGRWLHLRWLDRNRIQLHARGQSMSSAVRIGSNDQRETIPFSEVEVGDVLEIPRRGLVPARASLLEENATFALDWITGEPDPATMERGRELPAGARNVSLHPVRVLVREAYLGSFLESLFSSDLMEDAASADRGSEATARWMRLYMAVVLTTAFVGAAAWLAFAKAPASALQVLISVLVVSCPCALGLALPLLNEQILSLLREKGIYVRKHSLWARISKIHTIAFDKTGTLTEAIHRVANQKVFDHLDAESLAALRILTEQNEHPYAKAIREELGSRYGTGSQCSLDPTRSAATLPEPQYYPGLGVEIVLNGILWRLGRPNWAGDGDHKRSDGGDAKTDTFPSSSGCSLSADGVTRAFFSVAESLRDGAAGELEGLRRRGYRLHLISGDPNGSRVGKIAHELSFSPEEAHFDQSPEQKLALLEALGAENTLYMGDGGNDRLALSRSGVKGCPATGARAVESEADFVFTGRGFQVLTRILEAARRRRSTVLSLFVIALPYNATVIAISLAGKMNPLLAAILMPLSSLVTSLVAAYGARASTGKRRRGRGREKG